MKKMIKTAEEYEEAGYLFAGKRDSIKRLEKAIDEYESNNKKLEFKNIRIKTVEDYEKAQHLLSKKRDTIKELKKTMSEYEKNNKEKEIYEDKTCDRCGAKLEADNEECPECGYYNG